MLLSESSQVPATAISRTLLLVLNANREELRDAVRTLEERCVELEQERAAQHRQQQHQQQQSAQALHSLEEAVQRNSSSSTTAAQQQAESKSGEAPLKGRPDEEDDLDYEVIVDDLLQENEVSCCYFHWIVVQ
jgi:ATPase subunit of ABC transporter with duplicated ATPase domains